MHQFVAFNFQLTLWSTEVYDQPVRTPFNVTIATVVQGNANKRLTACDTEETFLTWNFRHVANVVFFLSGDSLASEILCANISEHSVCSSFIGHVHTTYEDGTDRVFWNVSI